MEITMNLEVARCCFAMLSSCEQRVLNMHLSGVKIDEIALSEGCSPEHVKAIISGAIEHLRAIRQRLSFSRQIV